MFALRAAAHITDGLDVLLLEAGLIVEDGDAVLLHDKCQRWNDTVLHGIAVVVSILDNKQNKEWVFQQSSNLWQCGCVSSHLNELQDKVCVFAVQLGGETVQAAAQSVLVDLHQLLTLCIQLHPNAKLTLSVESKQEVTNQRNI